MINERGWIKEGFFRDGELHGEGRIIDNNGIVLEGKKHYYFLVR